MLSQGERSRALIARALMGSPRVLLLDEPAARLDVAGREQLLASLAELRDREPRLAVVLVTTTSSSCWRLARSPAGGRRAAAAHATCLAVRADHQSFAIMKR